MSRKTTISAVAAIMAAVSTISGNASAHLEPIKDDGMEKCYGVVKAGQNDCSSVANNHGCASMAETDADPNEWVKVPTGLCEKIVNGSLAPSSSKSSEEN